MLKFWTRNIKNKTFEPDSAETCEADTPTGSVHEDVRTRRDCEVTGGVWESAVYLGPGGPVFRQY
jgi:hypothetical protein